VTAAGGFRAALSAVYGREVSAHQTLVEVSEQVNRDVLAAWGAGAERLGSITRVTAERYGAIRGGHPGQAGTQPVLRLHLPGKAIIKALRNRTPSLVAAAERIALLVHDGNVDPIVLDRAVGFWRLLLEFDNIPARSLWGVKSWCAGLDLR